MNLKTYDDVANHFRVSRSDISTWKVQGAPGLTRSPYDGEALARWLRERNSTPTAPHPQESNTESKKPGMIHNKVDGIKPAPEPSDALIGQFVTTYLEPVSRFLSTHGLAVFLVVYYATVIHRDSQTERKEWISAVTKLETSIDPERRPLSRAQAQAIFNLQTQYYQVSLNNSVEKLERVINDDGFRLALGGTSYGGNGIESTILGETFRFSHGNSRSQSPAPPVLPEPSDRNAQGSTPKDKSESDNRLETAKKKFEALLSDQRIELQTKLGAQVPVMTRESESTIYTLSQFRYGSPNVETLDTIWRDVFENRVRSEFEKDLVTAIVESIEQQGYLSYAKREFQDFERSATRLMSGDTGYSSSSRSGMSPRFTSLSVQAVMSRFSSTMAFELATRLEHGQLRETNKSDLKPPIVSRTTTTGGSEKTAEK